MVQRHARSRAPRQRVIMTLALVAGLMASLAQAMAPSSALANERIISDPEYQLALYGYDPVSFLADGQPRLGLPAHEFLYERLVWRFANEGNLQAFAQDPQRFVPAFGGHDALMMARGAPTPGHPLHYLVSGTRVLLFHNPAARYAFLLEPQDLLTRADARWPAIRETLAP